MNASHYSSGVAIPSAALDSARSTRFPLLQRCFSRRRTQKLFFFLLLLILGDVSNQASAQSAEQYVTQVYGDPSIGQDEYGVYMEFLITSRSIHDAKIYVTNAMVSASYTLNGYNQTINLFQFYNNAAGDDDVATNNIVVVAQSTGVRERADNGDDANNAWSGFTSSGNWVEKMDGGYDLMQAWVRWYVPAYLVNVPLTLHGSADYTGNGSGTASRSSTFTPYYPATFSPDFKVDVSSNPGKMKIQYAYTGDVAVFGGYNYTIQHWVDIDYAHNVTDKTNSSPSGALDVPINNAQTTHTFYTRYTGKDSHMSYDVSALVDVPAYAWPDKLTAAYNDSNTIHLSWDVRTPSGGEAHVDGDNFEVERSTDPSFATHTETVATYAYDAKKASYSVDDDLTDIQGGSDIYYRLRRTKTQTDWGWQVLRTADVDISMNSTQQADTAVLAYDNNTPQAIITWQPFRGVWVSGTKFSIKKSNKTTGAVAATFDLTEAQARSGTFTDDNITYCNEFTYSLIVTLGNGFSSPDETKVPGSILAVNIGTITGLTASKGYFPDRTELDWRTEGEFDNYIVKRKIYGSQDNYIQIANIPGSSSSELQTDDEKGAPGVYYEYMILGAVKCNNQLRYSKDTLYAVGFRAPTGNIYGRITYESGQAVENVSVRLENQDDAQLGQSVHLDGTDSSYLYIDTLHTLFADTAFTVEAWIRPDDLDPKNQVIFSNGDKYVLGFDGAGQLYFSAHGQTVSAAFSLANPEFVHIAAIQGKNMLRLMINDSVVAEKAYASAVPGNPAYTVRIGADASGDHFKGYVDEMSVWNTALEPAQIAKDYTRLITGAEKGLVAYWRFDETISDQFYDLSHTGDQYHKNDGVMNSAHVQRNILTPTAEQLSLKAFTDSTGNYMISGVPYSANGTTYAIVPLFGTHQFDPVAVNRLVSEGTNSFSVDFTDNSSFPVTGYVYYQDGTVPVSGVQFKIDGKYAQKSNGDVIETDATGKFTISVPVGTHEVVAVKNSHVFVGGGKITDRHGENLNYQEPVGPLTLYDSTRIRFIGRVAGGAVQDAFPLGHSLSRNNLGKQIKITMTLPSGSKYELHSGTPDTTIIVDHLLPSDQTDSSKIHKTRVVYYADHLEIYPDSLTGEFSADLIPESFLIDHVNVTGWDDLLDGKPVTMDFTNKFVQQSSAYDYTDSTQSASGAWSYAAHADTVFYNDSYKAIKRVTPTVEVYQLNKALQPVTFFGDTAYTSQSFTGDQITAPLVIPGATGKNMYVFGSPAFLQHKTYQFGIRAFEQYPFYESDEGGKKVTSSTDEVPTDDGQVSLYNNIQDGAAGPDTLSLDSSGEAVYSFTAGDPDLATGGIKDFSATVKFGEGANVSWSWLGSPQLKAYVLGGKMSGTDFVTAGPDELVTILRDPPGSNSYSFAESGSTITTSNTYTGSVDQVGDLSLVTNLGTELVVFTGVGVGTINSAVVKDGIGFGVHHEEHYVRTNTKEVSTTLTTRFATSSDPAYVGADGDLYVGYSTNITYGQSNNVTIIARDELKATDTKLFDPGAASPYILVQRSGVNIGQSFGTLFAYPQSHIENVLIPNLESIRNTVLLPPTTTATDAQLAADHGNEAIYVSKLSSDDPNFGKSNTDVAAFGDKAKTSSFGDGPSYKIYFPAASPYRTDTIQTINQYIKNWQDRMAANEQSKLNSKLQQNYSFHAGSPVDYSEQSDVNNTTSNDFTVVLSGSVFNTTDVNILGNGFNFTFNESIGTTQGGSIDVSTDNESTIGFELASEGSDEYLSVDVNKDDDGRFVFRTKGGVTGCPYEGAAATKYYKPGTILDQPTEQIEVPQISVDNPVVSDVPSSRAASYNLTLANASEAKLDGTYILTYADVDSVKGATISIDGTPIGGEGRTITVPYGQPVTKVLTLTKGPNAMDYNNIPIILRSACQSDIADTVLVSAHFVPSCSDINLKNPPDQWVVNVDAPLNSDGERYLPVTLDDFDVHNSLFDHIELQYKPSAQSQWITAMNFYADSAKLAAGQGNKAFITNTQALDYSLVMDDGSFNDQRYDVRAVSYCLLAPGDYITTPSNVASGIKDTYAPRLFGSPQPANGVLGVDDEIRLNFNEPIAAGLLTPSDFQVTGIRNGAQGDHSVSVVFDGKNDQVVSEFGKNLAGKDLTVEMWVLPDALEDGTIFSQGNLNNSLEMGFTQDNHLRVILGGKEIQSDRVLDYKPGEWAHVALVYAADSGTVSAFYNFSEVIHQVPAGSYSGTGPFYFGSSVSGKGGRYAGKMHGVRIWSEDLSALTLQQASLTRLSGAENSLLALYPMTEGKGTTVFDKAHGNNGILTGNWSTPAGKALQLKGNGYLKVNTSFAPITSQMDYTLSTWFKGAPGQSDAALVSSGKGDGTDGSGSKNLFFLGFENGILTFENNGIKSQVPGNYLDNNWHHVALAVNRTSGVAQWFLDGQMLQYFNTTGLGGISSAYVYLGARSWYDSADAVTPHFDRYFTGEIDEFRIWNTYLNQSLVNAHNNVRLNGDELGLLAYYPFEKYYEFQGQKELDTTAADQKIQEDPTVQVPGAVGINSSFTDDKAPIVDRGPVTNLQFDYVVNNDALIINMTEPKQAIDKTTVTFQVKKARDLNGNALASPITWSAYIDQNQLKWGDDGFNLSKNVYEPLEFESYVVNSGGNTEHFRLNNLPAWLKAEPSSGTVAPEGKQKITFTVDAGLNVGSYNEIVYMVNDNNESEALPVNLVVKGQTPAWQVTPGDYNYNMSIYGKIRVDGIFSSNPEDLLAAFIHGKCVGVTHNTYISGNDLWYCFLTVYSDSLKQDDLEFRIWDAANGKVYEATPSSSIGFQNNQIVGTSDNPVIFDGKELQYENIPLSEGWNWISFNLATEHLTHVADALENGDWVSGDVIKHDERGFDQYSQSSGWVGTLPALDNLSLFKLQTAQPQTLSVSGTPLDLASTSLAVAGGRWNYISFLPLVNMTVTEALAGYQASDQDVIKSQTGFSMYSSRNGWIGNLTYLEPGKGYMLYRKDASQVSFTYPVLSGSLATPRLASSSAGMRLNPDQIPVTSNYKFSDNMTLIANVDPGFKLLDGDEILAYHGTELRAKALAIADPETKGNAFFFNIAGANPGSLHFEVLRDGKSVAQTDAVIGFVANEMYGTLTEPVTLHFEKSGVSTKLFPNPFQRTVSIQAILEDGTHRIEMSVYDVRGRLMVRDPETTVTGNSYQAIWNGDAPDGKPVAAGVYFIHLTVDGKSHIYRVVKL